MPSASADIPSALTLGELQPTLEALLSLALYAGIALFLVGVLLLLAWALGHKTRNEVKQQPYESGIAPTGAARLGEPVPFYLVAIFFIVFDVEIVFVVSWAVAYDLLGWAGFAQMSFFIFMLFLGLVYLWKAGGLDWGPSSMRRKQKAHD